MHSHHVVLTTSGDCSAKSHYSRKIWSYFAELSMLRGVKTISMRCFLETFPSYTHIHYVLLNRFKGVAINTNHLIQTSVKVLWESLERQGKHRFTFSAYIPQIYESFWNKLQNKPCFWLEIKISRFKSSGTSWKGDQQCFCSLGMWNDFMYSFIVKQNWRSLDRF